MSTQKAFISGFVKRASEYGIHPHESLNILKSAAAPARANSVTTQPQPNPVAKPAAPVASAPQQPTPAAPAPQQPTPAAAPARFNSQQIQEQQQVMKMYPQLATQGSEMNKRFVEEYHRREAAGQPVNAVELGRELFGAPLTPNTPGTYTVRGTTYGNVSPEQQAHYRENVNRVMNQQRQIDEDRATRLNPVNRYDEVRRNIERRYGIGPSQEARYERDLQQAKDNSAQLKYYHNQEAQAKQDSAEKQRVGGYLANHELSPEERAYYQRRVAEINQRNSGPMAPPPPTPIRY